MPIPIKIIKITKNILIFVTSSILEGGKGIEGVLEGWREWEEVKYNAKIRRKVQKKEIRGGLVPSKF